MPAGSTDTSMDVVGRTDIVVVGGLEYLVFEVE
jgi:hypothetical protein